MAKRMRSLRHLPIPIITSEETGHVDGKPFYVEKETPRIEDLLLAKIEAEMEFSDIPLFGEIFENRFGSPTIRLQHYDRLDCFNKVETIWLQTEVQRISNDLELLAHFMAPPLEFKCYPR